MSYEFQPLSGGIDYVQPSEPTPEAGKTWADIKIDINGNPVDWQLKVSDGTSWWDV
jgi:hypothetical protein